MALDDALVPAPIVSTWSKHSNLVVSTVAAAVATNAPPPFPPPPTSAPWGSISMPRPSSSFNCITLALLILPAVVFAAYFLTSFPYAPESVVVHPSLASLLRSDEGNVAERIRSVYPDDFWSLVSGQGGGHNVEGGYVNMPLGRTRYWMMGPEDGRKLVLIHGLSVPSIIWKHVAPALARKGYRILLYDLYGRGYSDAPQVTYGTSLYVTQLALLLQYVGWERTNVVGISMGGGIATAFCVQFPHLVSGRAALLASAGIVEATDMSRTSRFLSSPLMQLATSSYPFRMYLKRLARTSNESLDRDDSFSELVRIQSAHLPGYNLALASSIRDGPVRNLAPVYAQLGRQTKKRRREGRPEDGKLLLVWGTRDKVVPYHYASRVLALLGGSLSSHTTYSTMSLSDDLQVAQVPMNDVKEEEAHVRLVTVDGAGHDLTSSHPELIVELLAAFFGEADAR